MSLVLVDSMLSIEVSALKIFCDSWWWGMDRGGGEGWIEEEVAGKGRRRRKRWRRGGGRRGEGEGGEGGRGGEEAQEADLRGHAEVLPAGEECLARHVRRLDELVHRDLGEVEERTGENGLRKGGKGGRMGREKERKGQRMC